MGALDFFPLRVEEHEEDGSLVLTLSLPGLDPEQDVDIAVADGVLEVCIERVDEETADADEEGMTRTESHFASYRRAVPLPGGTNPDDVTATYVDGVLAIRMPMSDESAPQVRHVPVQAGPVDVPVEKKQNGHRWSLTRKKRQKDAESATKS